MPELKKLDIAFEAPSRTLFLLDTRHLRILPFEESVEAAVPTTDFLDLLFHLVLHQAAALAILQIPTGLLERVLGGLTAIANQEHG
jgi:hypothetical protein